MARITPANSTYAINNSAFIGLTSDTLIVDADAFLISVGSGDGARLTGSWDVVINGAVAAFGSVAYGIAVADGISDAVDIRVGGRGDVFGGFGGIHLGFGSNTLLTTRH